jgi:hypothetical protein
MNRFCKGVKTDQYKKTVGADFMEKEVTSSGGEAYVECVCVPWYILIPYVYI